MNLLLLKRGLQATKGREIFVQIMKPLQLIKLIINVNKVFVSLIGPRNLTTKVDRKGKSTITANDNEIENMVEDVEEGEENELQENVILEEEDDLSDVDLGDNEWKHKIRM